MSVLTVEQTAILATYVCFVMVMFLYTLKDFDDLNATPNDIYETTNLNMFACVLAFIFMLIANPIFYIAKFLYWIFHVGRKD